MAESTGISWADATMNPWVGCEKVSPGCAHCYAESLVTGRMGRAGTWGPDGVRQRTSPSLWKKPLRWAALAREGRLPDGTENPDGHRPRIFCASLADVFEPRPELEPWREELFDLIEATPELDWLILTKRPDFAAVQTRVEWRLPTNVWMGTSIENSRFTWRADALRQIPATVRFISAEPLLGSLFLGPLAGESTTALDRSRRAPLNLEGIDWVIVGGESGGRNARPMHPAWAREIRDACLSEDYVGPGEVERVGPALHFKQWGSWAPDPDGRDPHAVWVSPDGRVRSSLAADVYDDLPDGSMRMRYAGASPKSAGKHLDGDEWCEFPTSYSPVLA